MNDNLIEADISHKKRTVYIKYSRARDVNLETGELDALKKKLDYIIENVSNAKHTLSSGLKEIDSQISRPIS